MLLHEGLFLPLSNPGAPPKGPQLSVIVYGGCERV